MPTATRTFRVFVSSTFEDLKAERDALQHTVFPKLRKLCEENGARFQAIDLRWGVRDEAALDQQTMEICLREIERCQQTGIKPNFIALLGERYGWRPLPTRIKAQEFDRVCGRVAEAADRQLIDAWYERDDNAVSPEYLLKPRSGEFVDKGRWGEIEQKLYRILREAVRDAGLTQEQLVKYGFSATHQEILKGLGEIDKDRKQIFAFFREPAPGIAEDPDLTALKKYLREKLADGNIRSFSASNSTKLCADLEELLKQVILAEAEQFTARPALDLEIEAHEAFAHDRARHFTGRKSVLAAVDADIRGGESRQLVVHGPSGCGKSAIVAKAWAQVKAEMPRAALIQRFIGVTPDSSSGITLLHSLCEQLSREYGVTEETPMDFQPLVVAFHARMARATAERPLVLFLDALDQLRSDDEVRSFTWLRQNLPPHVSLVVSTTEIPAGLQSASQLEVGDFPVREAEEVLAAWLQDVHRKLKPEQREKLLSCFAQSGLPLYLKLAFEEARCWSSFLAAEMCVLGNDVGGMIAVLFDRLSEERNHGPILVNRCLGLLAAARYGLTEDEMLDVLAADDEVWEDFESRAHYTPPERRLPVIVWSRLFLDLEPYLNERATPGGNVIAFYHRQIAERAASLYLQEDERSLRHAQLAKYFHRQDNFLETREAQRARARRLPLTPRPVNRRKVEELVYQRLNTLQATSVATVEFELACEELETLLTELLFLEAKTEAGSVFELARDFSEVVAALPETRPRHRILRLIEQAIGHDIHFLARHPVSLFQSAWNLCWWYDCPQAATHYKQPERSTAIDVPSVDSAAKLYEVMEKWRNEKERYIPGFSWLRSLRPPKIQLNTSMEAMFCGHDHSVESVAWCPDGKTIASGGTDKTVRIWERATGECFLVLQHPDVVNQVGWSPDGRLLACGSDDAVISLWDSLKRERIGTLLDSNSKRRSAGVASLAWSPDGRMIAASYKDGPVCVWDVESQRVVHSLPERSALVWSVAWSPDGTRLATANVDHVVNVWKISSGQLLNTLVGSTQYLACVQWSPDGRYIASGGGDRRIIVWNAQTGEIRITLPGLSTVHCLVWLGNRNWLASSGLDGIIRVWDIEAHSVIQEHSGHSEAVNAISCSPVGDYVVSASRDGRVGVWNTNVVRRTDRLRCEPTGSGNVRWSPDGKRIAVSGIGDSIAIFDLGNDAAYFELTEHMHDISSAEWSPSSNFLVSTDHGGRVRIWDINIRSCVLEFNESDELSEAHWSPQGEYVFVCLKKSRVLRIRPLNPDAQRHPMDNTQNVDGAIWSPDGEQLAIESRDEGTWDSTIRIMDAESARLLFTFPEAVFSFAWSPDCRWILSRDPETKTMSLWGGRDLRLAYTTLREKGKVIQDARFSLDSVMVATEDHGEKLEIRTVATGEILATWTGRFVTLPIGVFAPFRLQQDLFAVSIGTLDGQPPFAHFPRPAGLAAEAQLLTESSFRYWALKAARYFVLFRFEGTLPDIPTLSSA
jgi:WD40 repeat protein